MACIIDSNTETYIRGFEGVSDRDDFATELLERRLGATNVITLKGEINFKKITFLFVSFRRITGKKVRLVGNENFHCSWRQKEHSWQ
jgi:hypothetical protein